jgi:hypothetical protein
MMARQNPTTTMINRMIVMKMMYFTILEIVLEEGLSIDGSITGRYDKAAILIIKPTFCSSYIESGFEFT